MRSDAHHDRPWPRARPRLPTSAPIARPLHADPDDDTQATVPLDDPSRGERVVEALIQRCDALDAVYFDGRHRALAADGLSMALGVLRDLETRLAELHRLCAQTRGVTWEQEDLLKADAQRLGSHLQQVAVDRRELLRMAKACRELHQEQCRLQAELERARRTLDAADDRPGDQRVA